MALLHYLSWWAILAAFAFVTLSLASGLLYISELIEEHSRDAKIIGQRAIYLIISLHILLHLTDSLPLPHTLFSIFCHIIYLQNFSPRWPFISLTSLTFIASCVLVVVDHFMWFIYFARVSQEARHTAHRPVGTGGGEEARGFADIATFFGICVWLAPLFLFLSLSAGDHALPTSSASPASATTSLPPNPLPSHLPHAPSSLFKSLFSILPFLTRKHPHQSDGLIAPPPRTPTLPSIHSVPSSPIPGRSFTNPNPNRNSLPPPPHSPRNFGGERETGTGYSTHLSPHSLGQQQDFRLGAPPSRRTSRVDTRDSSTGPARRATVDSVGLGVESGMGLRRSPSRGRVLGYD